jgi:hypothetical protein
MWVASMAWTTLSERDKYGDPRSMPKKQAMRGTDRQPNRHPDGCASGLGNFKAIIDVV